MKNKTTLTFFFLMFALVAFAQRYPVGHLTVFSENGEKFFLILNGQQQNSSPLSNIRVEGLTEMGYNVQVIFMNRGVSALSKDISIADADGEMRDVTYKIKKDRKKKSKRNFQFVSMVPVRDHYNAPNTVFVIRYQPPVIVVPVDEPIQSFEPVGCRDNYPMGPTDFRNALATIKNQGFDDTRAKIAQQIVSANCLSTDQIIQVANTFGFDQSKLEFAKFAYDFCTDPKNYYKLSNVFGFSSSTEELSDYVQSRQ